MNLLDWMQQNGKKPQIKSTIFYGLQKTLYFEIYSFNNKSVYLCYDLTPCENVKNTSDIVIWAKIVFDKTHSYILYLSLCVTYSLRLFQTTTCKTAMGYAFAAGTTDGPGAFDFTQGIDV